MVSPPAPYDAVLLVSFGGPEGPDDVIPFLENVLRGRDVPRARLEEVAAHYYRFGGVSPINGQNRALIAALESELARAGMDLPVYWGNRNWTPTLPETLARMRHDGVQRALAFVTSAYSSYSGCRQYLDDIALARAALGDDAPVVDKLRPYFDHPGFVQANAEHLASAWAEAGWGAPVLFSAHSIPEAMAASCDYEAQLTSVAELVAAGAAASARGGGSSGGDTSGSTGGDTSGGSGGSRSTSGSSGTSGSGTSGPGAPGPWQLVYQSRSGPPSQPWLGPDVGDVIAGLPEETDSIVVAPIGFVSDHMEVVFDLDTQAAAAAARRGMRLVRAQTAGTHPAFVAMIRQLIEERLDPARPRLALTPLGPRPDVCPPGHCPAPSRRPASALEGTS